MVITEPINIFYRMNNGIVTFLSCRMQRSVGREKLFIYPKFLNVLIRDDDSAPYSSPKGQLGSGLLFGHYVQRA